IVNPGWLVDPEMHNRWPLVLNALGLLITHPPPGARWVIRWFSPHATSAATVSCARAIPPLTAAPNSITTTTTTRQAAAMPAPRSAIRDDHRASASHRSSTCISARIPAKEYRPLGRHARNTATGSHGDRPGDFLRHVHSDPQNNSKLTVTDPHDARAAGWRCRGGRSLRARRGGAPAGGTSVRGPPGRAWLGPTPRETPR